MQADFLTTQEKTSKSNMHESRCGLKCSLCPSRQEFGCEGCLAEKPPLAGEECEVKVCCESKGFEHCGECPGFPCDMLRNMSFDEEDGDDGKRILQCKHWLEEKTYKKESKRDYLIIGTALGLIFGAIIGSITASILLWIILGAFLGSAIAFMISITKHD